MKKVFVSMLLLITLLVTFVAGMRVGAETFFGFDSPYRAALTVAKLKSLESGDTDHLKDSLEYDLDSYIYSYGVSTKSMYLWVFPELTDRDEVANAMRHVVSYRHSHPPQRLDEEVLSMLSEDERGFINEQGHVILNTLNQFGYAPQFNQGN